MPIIFKRVQLNLTFKSIFPPFDLPRRFYNPALYPFHKLASKFDLSRARNGKKRPPGANQFILSFCIRSTCYRIHHTWRAYAVFHRPGFKIQRANRRGDGKRLKLHKHPPVERTVATSLVFLTSRFDPSPILSLGLLMGCRTWSNHRCHGDSDGHGTL